jgi:hypothetical protein
MKKTLLSIALVATGLVAFAQKPAAGDMTLETQFSLNMGGPNGFTTPHIRYRYFLNEGLAARVRLGIDMSSTTTHFDDGATPPSVKSESTASGFAFGLGIGAEKHLAGTDKLSPYFGAELMFATTGAGMTNPLTGVTNGNPMNVEVTNSNNGSTTTASGDSYKTTDGGNTAFGLNLVFGADYYIVDGVYLGGEMGWGWMMSSTAAQKTSSNAGGTTTESTSSQENSSNNLSMMNFPTTSIRLGIKF